MTDEYLVYSAFQPLLSVVPFLHDRISLLNYDHVFHVTGNAVIDASQEKVWLILTDFPSYGRYDSSVGSSADIDNMSDRNTFV